MKTIIIDAGHGGTDPGATAFGIKEKDWNLKMSQHQFERLKELGVKVEMTRISDITLHPTPIVEQIKNKYDYCISNHFNAFDGSARGVETIHSIYADSHFAKKLATAIAQKTQLPFRRTFSKKNEANTDWYFMHRLTGRTETVIIEYGFLDNKADFDYYKNEENFKQAAEVVVKVICEQIGKAYHPPKQTIKSQANQGNLPIYRVQVGAFHKKENADKQVQQLKKAGFDAIVTTH